MVRASHLLLLLATLLLAGGCQSNQESPDVAVPLTVESVAPLYADYAMDAADTDDNDVITVAEWTTAGGTKRSFARVDQNRNGVIQRRELIRFGSNARFLDFTRSRMDLNRDNRLTRREFLSPFGVSRLTRRDYHSPFGIRLLTLDF
jgi:hypothetical protein